MTYRYGRDWHKDQQRPIQEIDEAEARRRFVDGPQLSVSRVSQGQGVPDYTLILGADANHVRVRHYDAQGSIVQTLDWTTLPGEERLFMNGYSVHVYADEATGPQAFHQSVAHKTWVFRPDGTVTCREVVKPVPDARVTEYRDVDVSGNWRERPAFGDWDRFGEHPAPQTAPPTTP